MFGALWRDKQVLQCWLAGSSSDSESSVIDVSDAIGRPFDGTSMISVSTELFLDGYCVSTKQFFVQVTFRCNRRKLLTVLHDDSYSRSNFWLGNSYYFPSQKSQGSCWTVPSTVYTTDLSQRYSSIRFERHRCGHRSHMWSHQLSSSDLLSAACASLWQCHAPEFKVFDALLAQFPPGRSVWHQCFETTQFLVTCRHNSF